MNKKNEPFSIKHHRSHEQPLDRHGSRLAPIGASFCAVAFAFCGASLAQEQTVVTQDLTLNADHEGPLLIVNSGVTVDCQNFRVIEPYPMDQDPEDGEGEAGILLDFVSDVTVQNCNIEDFWFGIRVLGGTGAHLVDNTVIEKTQPTVGWVVRRAFSIEGSNGNVLIGNTEADTNGDGFSIVTSNDNHLSGNSAGGGGNAYELFTADDNQLLNNTASAGGEGFNISDSHGNEVIANTVSYQINGFRIYGGSSDNTIKANAITNNVIGILVCPDLRDENSLSPNRFRNNGADIVEGGDASSCP